MLADQPLLYHIHHSRFVLDVPFWRSLAKQQGDFVLELGCGGGRVLLALAAAGSKVIGLDRDYAMLELLRKAAQPQLLGRVSIFQADMNYFSLKPAFPLILMTCNTLSALPDGERQGIFHRISDHLEARGVFAASLPNPELLLTLADLGDSELEEEFVHPTTGNPVQVSSAWSRAGNRVEVQWHYDHLDPDGSVRRSTVSVSHSLTSIEQYSKELSAAGMKLVNYQGDFDGRPYNHDSPYFIFQSAHRN